MGIFQIIGAIFTLSLELFKLWREHDADVKAVKKEAMKDALEAIEHRDSSALTIAFSRLRN